MRTIASGRRAGLAVVLTCAAVLAMGAATGCAAPASSQPGMLSASIGGNAVALLKTAHTTFGTVLTNGAGYTLYWFSKDTPTTSGCDVACLDNWPPVTGTPRLAAGVRLPGELGTMVRSG